MKIYGIGADIEEVARFRKKLPAVFYKKVYTDREIAYCRKKKNSAECFAVRFAAKEAVIKSVGGAMRDMKKIEIANDRTGQPRVLCKKKNGHFLLSLSHTKNNAIAFVLWHG